VETIDALLGYVGRRVLVAVYGWGDGELPYVMLKGTLRQGEPGGHNPETGAPVWDYFGVGDDPTTGIYLNRRQFVSGKYAEERLTIVLGRVGITVDVDVTGPDTPPPNV